MAELYVDEARKSTSERIEKLRSDLVGAKELVEGKACVYATGSFGRLEASELSDLDVFTVIDVKEDDDGNIGLLLDGVDHTKLKYDLIRVAEENGITKFDASGKYLLASHPINEFTEWLGSDEDDYRNTLTARMLMLLESKCLVGESTYKKAINEVISAYFRDYSGHEGNFIPSFLINDILRMWRTFCVNYEFYRKDGDSREKIKNLKLKFSRMLTCYSGIIYLLAVYSKNKTVAPADVEAMVSISPTERLEALARKEFWGDAEVPEGTDELVVGALSSYSDFLRLTHQPVRKAVQLYRREEAIWREKSYGFGGTLSKLIDLLGSKSEEAAQLRRLIMI